jgi:hypothetical protein
MTIYTGDPLKADDLSHRVIVNPDRSFHVEVHERLAEDTYRVLVIRCQGKELNFMLPIPGYCAGQLYQNTKQLMAVLVPGW